MSGAGEGSFSILPESFALPWDEYLILLLAQERRPAVRIRESNGVPSYLAIIRRASELFMSKKSLSSMTEQERWELISPHHGTPYFGMMFVATSFRNVMRDSPLLLDAALDEIPARADVSKEHYDRFVKKLPPNARGVVSSTRLLAMKRPDRFLCLDAQNRRMLGPSFGMRHGVADTFKGYWDLVNAIWRCAWASSERPVSELDSAIWDSRVAILEAFCYAASWPACSTELSDNPTTAVRATTLRNEGEAAIEPYDPTDEQDGRLRLLSNLVRRQGQGAFRRDLLLAYESRCCVTGCTVPDVLEAAHILPYRGAHTNHVSNGLLLRSDLHALFDLYLLRVDPETYSVRLDLTLAGTQYAELQARFLSIPADPNCRPSREALRRREIAATRDDVRPSAPDAAQRGLAGDGAARRT